MVCVVSKSERRPLAQLQLATTLRQLVFVNVDVSCRRVQGLLHAAVHSLVSLNLMSSAACLSLQCMRLDVAAALAATSQCRACTLAVLCICSVLLRLLATAAPLVMVMELIDCTVAEVDALQDLIKLRRASSSAAAAAAAAELAQQG